MDKKIKHLKNWNLNTPSWDNILNNLNKSIESINSPYPGFMINHEGNTIEKVSEVLPKLGLKNAHVYCHLFPSLYKSNKHTDVMDVYYWQVKGEVIWIINEKDKYHLNEGDLIFVPKGIPHEVIPLTPRAGISMA